MRAAGALLAGTIVVGGVLGAGCRCSGAPAASTGGALASSSGALAELGPPTVPPPPPPPSAWSLAPLVERGTIAIPKECRPRAPFSHAPFAPGSRFVAEPTSLGALVVGEPPAPESPSQAPAALVPSVVAPSASGSAAPAASLLAEAAPAPSDAAEAPPADPSDDDEQPLARAGVLSFVGDARVGAAASVPWFFPSALPRLARLGARGPAASPDGRDWVALVEQRAGDRASEVVLWRRGEPASAPPEVHRLGAGAGYEAADLACDASRCLALTSRMGPVERPGAELVAWRPASPPSRALLAPKQTDTDATPFRFARAASGALAAVTLELGELGFYPIPLDGESIALDPGGSARVPVAGGPLAVALLDAPTAVLHADPLADNGCALVPSGERARVLLAQPGSKPVSLELATAPPERAVLVATPGGGLLLLQARLGCEESRRLTYAVFVDGKGSPTGPLLPVGDAELFAVASEGPAVDLWLLQERDLRDPARPPRATLARLSCTR